MSFAFSCQWPHILKWKWLCDSFQPLEGWFTYLELTAGFSCSVEKLTLIKKEIAGAGQIAFCDGVKMGNTVEHTLKNTALFG